MDIKKYLKENSYISVREIERLCSIPSGTIRLTSVKPIPKKYENDIIKVLGLDQKSNTNICINELQQIDNQPPYIDDGKMPITNDMMDGFDEYIVKNGKIGFMDGILFRRKELNDGDKVYLKK